MAHLSNVAARVRQILDDTDKKIAEWYGSELPDAGAGLLTVSFLAEDADDVAAAEILVARGVAQWMDDHAAAVGASFIVEALGSRKQDANAGQTKATLALAVRIDALEGMIDRLIEQNERLLTAQTAAPKALPAAKKKAAKKGGRRG